MPPQGLPRPDNVTLDGFVAWLESSIDREATGKPNPGRASLHRLNRTEYQNAIRDLLDLDIDASALLPADDESYGFDNIADVLKVSPSLLEQYLVASHKISSLAVGDPGTMPISHFHRIPPDRAQDEHIEGLPLGTRGGSLIRHTFPLDATYQFSVKLTRNIVGYITGLEFPHELEISVDGERVFLAPVGGDADNKMSDENMSAAGDKIDERLKTRIPVKAGPRIVDGGVPQKERVRVRRAAAAARAGSRSAEHERDSAHRLRRHPRALRRHRRPAIRPAVAAFSCAVRLRPPPPRLRRGLAEVRKKSRRTKADAPGRSCRRWRAGRIGGP